MLAFVTIFHIWEVPVIRMLVAFTVVSITVTACESGDISEDATTDSFCRAYSNFVEAEEDAENLNDYEILVDAGEELRDTGVPDDMPDAARENVEKLLAVIRDADSIQTYYAEIADLEASGGLAPLEQFLAQANEC